MGHSKFLLCPLRAYLTNSLHCMDDVSWINSGTKGQTSRSRSHGLLEVFAVSVLWLRGYFTNMLDVWHKYNPWGDVVSRTISRSKVQRSWSHRLFELFAVSTPWLCDQFNSFHMWHKYNPWGVMCRTPFLGQKVKVTWVIQSFCCVCFMPVWQIHFIHGTNATLMGRCVAHYLLVKRSKVKVTVNFKVRSMATCLFDQFAWYVAQIKAMRGQYVPHHFQVKRSQSGSHRSFKVFAMSTLWLYLTNSLHIGPKYNPWSWGEYVSCTIFSSKVTQVVHIYNIGLGSGWLTGAASIGSLDLLVSILILTVD